MNRPEVFKQIEKIIGVAKNPTRKKSARPSTKVKKEYATSITDEMIEKIKQEARETGKSYQELLKERKTKKQEAEEAKKREKLIKYNTETNLIRKMKELNKEYPDGVSLEEKTRAEKEAREIAEFALDNKDTIEELTRRQIKEQSNSIIADIQESKFYSFEKGEILPDGTLSDLGVENVYRSGKGKKIEIEVTEKLFKKPQEEQAKIEKIRQTL